MRLETFRGTDLRSVMSEIRGALGEEAMIVRTHVTRRRGAERVEVVAALASEVERLRVKLDGARAAAVRARGRKRLGPYVVALVGPSGAGKTTACMKVALSPAGVASRKVGLLSLDTYRVGALEEIQTYAEITGLPLEVAYGPADAPPALQRLRDRDVVLVDTPGRGFGGRPGEWMETLRALDPDEIHLVVPAWVRPGAAQAFAAALDGIAPTHVLFTKVDEVPGDVPLAALAEATGLPARWVSQGHEVPSGLVPAGPRILSSLAAGSDEPRPAVTATA